MRSLTCGEAERLKKVRILPSIGNNYDRNEVSLLDYVEWKHAKRYCTGQMCWIASDFHHKPHREFLTGQRYAAGVCRSAPRNRAEVSAPRDRAGVSVCIDRSSLTITYFNSESSFEFRTFQKYQGWLEYVCSPDIRAHVSTPFRLKMPALEGEPTQAGSDDAFPETFAPGANR